MDIQDNPNRSDMLHCPLCGEDYSSTYRRCPFCEGMVGHSTGRTPSRRSGGKRKSPAKSGGIPMEPVRLIGYVLGLILIVAAIYIVYAMLAPLFGSDAPAASSSSVQSSVSLSQPASSSQPEVSTSTSASTSTPDVSASTPAVSVSTPAVVTPAVTTTDIKLSKSDFTLKANESHKLTATITPSNSEEAVTWTSSDPSVAHVGPDGTVTNVNTGTGTKAVTITATSGSVSAQCTVRCYQGSTGAVPTTPAEPTTPTAPAEPSTPAASTKLPDGTEGTITSGGVRIRSGPGSNYERQASATKGAKVTVLEKTADGWYKIEYIGNGGRSTGYISAEYVSIN